MRPLVWLASYPKSGNTWLRLLFAAYDAIDDEPLAFQSLAQYANASRRAPFDDVAGVESSEMTDAEIDLLLPRVFERLAADARAQDARTQVVLKVHDAYRRNAAGEPCHPASIGAAVYVLRNPLDVAVSFAHHVGLPAGEMVDRLRDPDSALGRSSRRDLHQLPQPLGTWSDHVRSWVDEPALDALVVRYEDLRRDPATVFARVLAHVGRTPDPARVRRAVDATAFERLQRLEAERGFREAHPSRSAPFFREGRAGGWRAALDAEQVARVVESHGDTMRRFGYLDDAGEPVAG